jgi:hypothetical protein
MKQLSADSPVNFLACSRRSPRRIIVGALRVGGKLCRLFNFTNLHAAEDAILRALRRRYAA